MRVKLTVWYEIEDPSVLKGTDVLKGTMDVVQSAGGQIIAAENAVAGADTL